MFAIRTHLASATIGIACLLSLFPLQHALAEEPIQRAFGQTLGAVFDPATSGLGFNSCGFEGERG
jgi:hypothetical protein